MLLLLGSEGTDDVAMLVEYHASTLLQLLAEGIALLVAGDGPGFGSIGFGGEVGALVVEDVVLDDVRKATIGREAYIYIIIIIGIELQEPVVLVVLQTQVQG